MVIHPIKLSPIVLRYCTLQVFYWKHICILYLHNFYGFLLAWSAHHADAVYFGFISKFHVYGTFTYFVEIRNNATRIADQNSSATENCGISPQKAFLHIQILEWEMVPQNRLFV